MSINRINKRSDWAWGKLVLLSKHLWCNTMYCCGLIGPGPWESEIHIHPSPSLSINT